VRAEGFRGGLLHLPVIALPDGPASMSTEEGRDETNTQIKGGKK